MQSENLFLYKKNNIGFSDEETIVFDGRQYDLKKCIVNFKENISRADFVLKKITELKLKTTIKISCLNQLKLTEKYTGTNCIKAVEYGEISRTADLQKFNIIEIAEKIKDFCQKNNILFYYATPKILVERDYGRVYGDIKTLFQKIRPDALVVNNLRFLKDVVKDTDYKEVKLHTGQGIQAESSVNFPIQKHNITAVDFSRISSINGLIRAVKEQEYAEIKKYTVIGNRKICEREKCPLNDTKEKTSGLYCSAPCTRGAYALKNPETDEVYPFITDGFCLLHLYDCNIFDITGKTDLLKTVGINEFIADISSFVI